MSKSDFIKNKLSLMKKDAQDRFKDFVEPLQEMVEKQEFNKTVKIPADGNWFKFEFNAIQIKENRLVISAKKIENGFVAEHHNPHEKVYKVMFQGTRAAYIRGNYEATSHRYGWSFIHWDVRSYANHPINKDVRIYVDSFRARDEIVKLIKKMEGYYGTSNILNSYIKDNLTRFQMGINAKKTPQQIEKEWSQGLMENLRYKYIEAKDVGYPKGKWTDVKVHWCKKENDLRF